jgi:hypothetical protein
VQPANVTTPEDAATGSAVQLSVAPGVPVPAVMESDTDSDDVVTTSPETSSTVTTGWVANGAPCAEPIGSVPNTSLDAAPATVKLELVPDVSPEVAADTVKLPWVPRDTLQPANVTTPAEAETGFVVQASVPDPEAIASVTDAALVVTTSPEASSTLTTGWELNAVPPVALDGWVVKTSWEADPATVKPVLVEVVSPLAVADSVKLPCVPRVTLQPANVATPETAVTGLVVHARVPDPVAIARVTEAALDVTTSPEASSTLTTGWVLKAVPPVALDGWVAKTSWDAAPATVKLALVAELRPLEAADTAKLPGVPRVIAHLAKVATPLNEVTGFVVHASVPVPVAIESVTGAELVVTTSPEASSTLTTGWELNAVPLVALEGCVVSTSFVALPATVKLELVAVVSPVLAAESVKLPCVPRVIVHPAKVATPLDEVTGLVVHASVPVPDAIASVTGAELVVTTSPAASSTLTTGWELNGDPPVAVEGWVV